MRAALDLVRIPQSRSNRRPRSCMHMAELSALAHCGMAEDGSSNRGGTCRKTLIFLGKRPRARDVRQHKNALGTSTLHTNQQQIAGTYGHGTREGALTRCERLMHTASKLHSTRAPPLTHTNQGDISPRAPPLQKTKNKKRGKKKKKKGGWEVSLWQSNR